jgi:hypothetical protein
MVTNYGIESAPSYKESAVRNLLYSSSIEMSTEDVEWSFWKLSDGLLSDDCITVFCSQILFHMPHHNYLDTHLYVDVSNCFT